MLFLFFFAKISCPFIGKEVNGMYAYYWIELLCAAILISVFAYTAITKKKEG